MQRDEGAGARRVDGRARPVQIQQERDPVREHRVRVARCRVAVERPLGGSENVDVVVRGRADKVHEVASKLIATKGVQNGKLVTTTPEMKH